MPDVVVDQERLALPIMGQTQSWDNAWDLDAMSTYNTITSLAESPVAEGVLYVGTDDGLVQVSTDDGDTWKKSDRFPEVPEMMKVGMDTKEVIARFEAERQAL